MTHRWDENRPPSPHPHPLNKLSWRLQRTHPKIDIWIVTQRFTRRSAWRLEGQLTTLYDILFLKFIDFCQQVKFCLHIVLPTWRLVWKLNALRSKFHVVVLDRDHVLKILTILVFWHSAICPLKRERKKCVKIKELCKLTVSSIGKSYKRCSNKVTSSSH